MQAVLLGLRTLGREWRSGELGVLLLALAVAVAALTGVGLLVDRVDRAMRLQASEVLGADLRLQAPNAPSREYLLEARKRGIAVSQTTAMLSVVLHGDASQLANLYAVAPGYPLRGAVRVTDRPFGAPSLAQGIPGRGEAWPDSRLAAALGVQPGDSITVGTATLRIARIFVSRPDQGSGFVDLAPTMLINDADLPATQLIRPGSRVSYALLFSGSPGDTAAFAAWLTGHKRPGERLRDLREASPEVGNATARAGQFLQLASLAAALLCAVAVAMTARRYVHKHLDVVALLKTLGASRRFVLTLSLGQLIVIAGVATLLGSAAGLASQAWLIAALHGLLVAELPAPGLAPLAMGFVTAVLLLTGFALPPILQLSQVPAIRILRRETGAPRLAALLAFGPAVGAVGLLIGWVTQDLRLAAEFALGLLIVTVMLGAAGWLLVHVVAALRGGVGVAWCYGLANLARRRADSIAQIIAFGLGLSALLVLAVIRGDLISSWQASLPRDAPNFFFINIPPDDRESFSGFIAAHGGHVTRMLPMIRGRLTAINGEPVAGRRFAGSRGEGFAQREQNLSWSAELGDGNRITAGRWFSTEDAGRPLVSVATDFQEALGLQLGDRLTFDVAGERYEVAVASFRKVKWESLQPNFFLLFPPGLLDATAGTYMTSAHYSPTEAGAIAGLVRRFPSVSVFDMGELLGQVRSILDKAVLAVQSVFVFTLFAGLTVLLAAVQSSRDERRYESAMLRTLGARTTVVLQGVLVEFAAIGFLAGLLAVVVSFVAGYLLATRLLDVPYRPDPVLWFAGPALAVALVCGAGYLATRSAVQRSPLQVLRQG
jgi:putative ABC transport system permease protein